MWMNVCFLFTVLLTPSRIFAFEIAGDTIDHTMCVAIYSYHCQTTDMEGDAKTISYSLAVQVGRTFACSMGLASHDEEQREEYQKELQQFVPVCYQNYPKGQLTALETIPFNRFKTQEKMGGIKWRLTAEQDTVCGYACQKATGTYYGREWTVWFAKDIPCQAGPWRLHGLPGLIMKAEADGIHSFECIEVRRVKEPIVYHLDAEYTSTTHKKFVKYRNPKLQDENLLKDPSYLFRTVSVENMTVFHGLPIINGIPAPSTSTTYQPLELR